MNLPNSKEIAKLAKLCRKLGLKSFKCQEFEFVLDDRTPIRTQKSPVSKKKTDLQETLDQMQDEIPGDMPDPEALLFWSAGQTEDPAEQVKQ